MSIEKYEPLKVIKNISSGFNKPKGRSFKRLYFDIETSPNIVYSWNVGYDIKLDYSNIIKERAIICICYKWSDEKKVNYLHWEKGDDKKMLSAFTKIMAQADEIIGHNGDRFDIKWFKTRCIYHGIPAFPKYTTVDTLKLSRSGFKFNSNRLDYISRFLGIGHKAETGGFDLWKSVVDGNKKSLDKMVRYCKKDVLLLEAVHNRLNPYVEHKTHAGVIKGSGKCSCPNCASTNYHRQGNRITATGVSKIQLQCKECGKYWTMSQKVFEANK